MEYLGMLNGEDMRTVSAALNALDGADRAKVENRLDAILAAWGEGDPDGYSDAAARRVNAAIRDIFTEHGITCDIG